MEEIVTLIIVFLQSFVFHVVTTMFARSPIEPSKIFEGENYTGIEDYQTDYNKDKTYNI
jgi:hypothetical protein